MHRLILRPGTPQETVYQLRPGPNSLGRTDENDVQLAHKSVSRAHARLTLTGDLALLEDLGSKNGTFVDGARIDRLPLRASHELRCGDVPMRYEAKGAVVVQPTLICDASAGRTQLAQLLDKSSRAGAALHLGVETPDRARQKLEILLKVSELLSSPAPIDDVLTRILNLVLEILDVDRGMILMFTDGELVPRVSKSRTGTQADAAFSSQIANYVVEKGVAGLFSDTRHDPRLAGGGSILAQSICAAMCVPLRPREDLIGVLYVDNQRRAGGFTKGDLEFLAAFGNQAGIAIENAMLTARLAQEAVTRNNLVRFFPPAAVDTIMTSGASLEPRETQATVLFSDICGYTALSSELRPRDIINLLNDYLPVMSDIVFRYEGTLEKFIGDAMLAVWGAPFARDDDAYRAVAAAVDMQRALGPLREKLALPVPLNVHIGINTGTVVAGNIGSDRYLQYATIGDATNVASRICTVASADEILIDASTAALLRDRWPLEALPPVEVKGKREALSLFRVKYD